MSGAVLVMNGPNLNLLGERDPDVYGSDTLADIEQLCREEARSHGLTVEFFQSNHEGALIDKIHEVRRTAAAVVVNLGAYSHTSIALMDALAVLSVPIVEVHLSDIHAREEFRRHSYVSHVATKVIVGEGAHGYVLALRHVAQLLDSAKRAQDG